MENGQEGVNGNGLSSCGDSHVQEVVRAAHDELRQLIRQRAEIMKRIGTVKQTIAGLANLFGDDVLNDDLLELIDRKTSGRQPGFTKACRTVLMERSGPWERARSVKRSSTAFRNCCSATRTPWPR